MSIFIAGAPSIKINYSQEWEIDLLLQFCRCILLGFCSGGNKAGDGSGSSRKSEEEEGSKLGTWNQLSVLLGTSGGVGSQESTEKGSGRPTWAQLEPSWTQLGSKLGPDWIK